MGRDEGRAMNDYWKKIGWLHRDNVARDVQTILKTERGVLYSLTVCREVARRLHTSPGRIYNISSVKLHGAAQRIKNST